MQRFSSLALLALCAAAAAVCFVSVVDGAGYSKLHAKRTEIPASFGRPRHFPSAEAIAASEELQALYAGDAKITVHVVPHTHDDVGWLKTVDQYYMGANNSIQHAAVHHILDTVVEELQKNPNRKFIYVEQAFFQMWWERQTEEVQAATKTLVSNGQIEFINGGWSDSTQSIQRSATIPASPPHSFSVLAVLFDSAGACTMKPARTTWI